MAWEKIVQRLNIRFGLSVVPNRRVQLSTLGRIRMTSSRHLLSAQGAAGKG
jgi:hypothetical protein